MITRHTIGRTNFDSWHRAECDTLITCPVPANLGMLEYQQEVQMWMLDNNIVGGIYAVTWLVPRSIRWSIPDEKDRTVFALRWTGKHE